MNFFTKRFDAIIFDMDGTIVESNQEVWLEAIISFLSQCGISEKQLLHDRVDIEDVTTGIDLKSIAVYLKSKYHQVRDIETAKIKLEILSILQNNDLRDLRFVSGFKEFMAKTNSLNIPVALATNSHRPVLQKIQAKMSLDQFFGNHLYCVDDVSGLAKPDPTLFLHAAKQLNVSPNRCLVFEDSFVGMLAANAAGMKCIAIENGLNQKILHMALGAVKSYDDAEKLLLDLVDSI